MNEMLFLRYAESKWRATKVPWTCDAINDTINQCCPIRQTNIVWYIPAKQIMGTTLDYEPDSSLQSESDSFCDVSRITSIYNYIPGMVERRS